MSAFVQDGWFGRLGMAAIVLLGMAAVAQSVSAQTRTLTTLSDVPIYVPAPYYPHIFASYYSIAPYGGTYSSVEAHYWH